MTQVTVVQQEGRALDLAAPRQRLSNGAVSTSPAAATPSSWALAPALRARLLGTGLLAAGLIVGAGALMALLGVPEWVLSGLVVLALVLVVAVAALLGVRRWVVRFDDHGYRVRVLRVGGARAARWTDVLDLQTATSGGSRSVVLRLRDGRTTTIPVDAVEGDPAALVEALRARLDRGHGYRRVR